MINPQTKLFIVDDHQMIVDGLKSLLNNEDQYQVVGCSNQPLDVIKLLETTPVDILLTDINMPEMSGVELTRVVKKQFPSIKILALSMFGDYQVIKEMIDAGISGYILKNTGKQGLLEALRRILEGHTYFSEEVTQELMKGHPVTGTCCLTNREIEIIRLIEQELSNKQIADKLFISERTVETHRKNIFRKTCTQSLVGLLKYAYEHKIV
ncbi:response regulator transcription factor [Pedobacter changchengzhani]|uniref:Response regulator transcription factor n=1 Tax=Pedobacter changchengzhani TaxID=2529274 RepID=A0A4R5MP96_9SPHI|nr:response regulator transcription factor [Pedobacter changchengzhani]TDG37446.1 response regulator transcription factor [Pedobacter changchengzhani]